MGIMVDWKTDNHEIVKRKRHVDTKLICLPNHLKSSKWKISDNLLYNLCKIID